MLAALQLHKQALHLRRIGFIGPARVGKTTLVNRIIGAGVPILTATESASTAVITEVMSSNHEDYHIFLHVISKDELFDLIRRGQEELKGEIELNKLDAREYKLFINPHSKFLLNMLQA